MEHSPEGPVISDYKSGRAPSNRYRKDRLEQVLLYAAALAELDGTLPARARLMYLGQRIVETEVTADGIEKVTQRLADTWEDLLERSATGDFPPQPGPLCGWCAFVEHCPEGLAEVERRYRSGTRQPDAPRPRRGRLRAQPETSTAWRAALVQGAYSAAVERLSLSRRLGASTLPRCAGDRGGRRCPDGSAGA